MVAFATDDDREFGPVLCLGGAEGLEGLEDQRSFLYSDDIELALRRMRTWKRTGTQDIPLKHHRDTLEHAQEASRCFSSGRASGD